jgi:hypothetical protein
MPAILFVSIATAPHHGSTQDACFAELSAFLNLRLRPCIGSCVRPADTFLLHVFVQNHGSEKVGYQN